MERFFILDKYNTWYDWGLILTSKDITPPEPKTNYIELDGMSGSLDLSEALTGEVVYKDRTITASFWTNEGTRNERAKLIRDITTALHGKKIKVIEPDDPYHYFYGRVVIDDISNSTVYLEFSIEITCEPWRYALEDTTRTVTVTRTRLADVVLNNHGVKTLTPIITVGGTGTVKITYNGGEANLTKGTYRITDIRLKTGANVVSVSGYGTVTFTYKEADL